jgi:hypothetical protein
MRPKSGVTAIGCTFDLILGSFCQSDELLYRNIVLYGRSDPVFCLFLPLGHQGRLFGPPVWPLAIAQSHTRAAAVLVDELNAGQLQGPSYREIVSRRHGRLAAGKFGAANSCDANRGLASKISGPPLN